MIPNVLFCCLLGVTYLAVTSACRSSDDCPGGDLCLVITPEGGSWSNVNGPRVGQCKRASDCKKLEEEFKAGKSREVWDMGKEAAVVCNGSVEACGASNECNADSPLCISAVRATVYGTMYGCTTVKLFQYLKKRHGKIVTCTSTKKTSTCGSSEVCADGEVCMVQTPANEGNWTHYDNPRVGMCIGECDCLAAQEHVKAIISRDGKFLAPNIGNITDIACGGKLEVCEAPNKCSAERPVCLLVANVNSTVAGCTSSEICQEKKKAINNGKLTVTCTTTTTTASAITTTASTITTTASVSIGIAIAQTRCFHSIFTSLFFSGPFC